MATRKSKLPKLDSDAKSPERIDTDISVAEQTPKQSGKRAENSIREITTKRLFDAIEAAAPAVDGRGEIPVTVIIPAYLRDEQDILWLIEAAQSIAFQSAGVKCIIVENGSDYLVDVIEKRFSITHSEKGLSKARNFGIRKSDTEFFFPLDANDWLPPNALETIYTKRADKGFTYGSTMLFRGERGGGDQHLYDAKPYDFKEVMKMVYFPNGALQRKADWEKVGGYRESLPFLEDWDYWITSGENGICGTAIQDVTYWYRQHSGIVVSKTNPLSGKRSRQKFNPYIMIFTKEYLQPCVVEIKQSQPLTFPQLFNSLQHQALTE